MTTSRAIIIAGLLIAAAILVTNRYTVVTTDRVPRVYKVDQLTGETVMCTPMGDCSPTRETR